MSEKTTANIADFKINEKIESGATAILTTMSLEEGGQIKVTEQGVEALLEHHGTNLAEVKKAQEALTATAASLSLATGLFSQTAMGKDKGLDRTEINVKLGNDVFSADYRRKVSYPNLKDPSGPGTTKFGVLTPHYETHCGTGSRGQQKKVRSYLNARAAELFGE